MTKRVFRAICLVAAVVLLAADDTALPSQTETKLVQVAASFLGRQMEE